MEIVGVDSDLHQEYTRQREHLEHNLATLKKKVVKESEIHRADYVRIMQVQTQIKKVECRVFFNGGKFHCDLYTDSKQKLIISKPRRYI